MNKQDFVTRQQQQSKKQRVLLRLLILQHLLKRLDEKRVYKVSAAPSRKKQEHRLPPVVALPLS